MDIKVTRNRIANVKIQHPDCACVGFVQGAFVDFYLEDACVVSAALGLPLSKIGDIPSCYFLASRIDKYGPELLAAGINVAIEYPQVTDRDQQYCDAVPFDPEDLSHEEQQKLRQLVSKLERNRLRAAALHERIAAYGLAAEANCLGVRDMYGVEKDDKLDALETIIAIIAEAGGVPSQTRQ